ncbi:Oidioi.mRNA.OKI2018_I69.chr2.g6690.t1.cds [Oikopleura dioica]|uniref:Oidioi.mRNA.OKI2018_I69.chr2.g6690.t1.cds n=1 Tax=Oikopleura dioica TaxID=34765 RepID=A0ABN7T3T3_OIKDI|nr:Oidioi.mRNA.OKI2018_I69.chr2.g6690.t1.cds [Oikopleura dioica]
MEPMPMWDGSMATPNGGMHASGNQQNPAAQQHHQLHNQHQLPPHSQHQNGNPNHFNQNMSNNQMPPSDKHNPVGAWQRGGWDSGIHSGATSQTPSIVSGQHSELSAIVSEFSEHIPNFEQQAQQGAHNPNGQTNTSAVEAAQEMQQMFDYQDEEGMATAIPKLVDYLKNSDTTIVQSASQTLHQFSKRDAAKSQLITQRNVIPTLIIVLQQTNDPDTARAVTGTLHNVSQSDPGRKMIYQSSGIPALVKVLQCSVDAVVFYAITTIHNLLLHIKESKQNLRQTNATHLMVDLLQKKGNVKFLAICTDCLHLLSYQHNDTKMQMFQAGAAHHLINIMNQNTYEKLLWTTSRVLKVLSVCNQNKRAIVEAGGVQALGLHLQNGSSRLISNCLWTLRNLSDCATHIGGLSPLLQALLQRLNSQDHQNIVIACGTIANLSCNNIQNKVDIVRHGGIESLLRVIQQVGDRAEIVEPALCALKHITSRHPEADRAQAMVREAMNGTGLQLLHRLIQPGSAKPSIRKGALLVMKQLALEAGCRRALGQADIVGELTAMAMTSGSSLQQNPGDRDAISTLDSIFNIFIGLIKEPDLKMRIKSQQNLPFFIQLFHHQHLQMTVGALLGNLCVTETDVLQEVERSQIREQVERVFQHSEAKRVEVERRSRGGQMGGPPPGQQGGPPGHPGGFQGMPPNSQHPGMGHMPPNGPMGHPGFDPAMGSPHGHPGHPNHPAYHQMPPGTPGHYDPNQGFPQHHNPTMTPPMTPETQMVHPGFHPGQPHPGHGPPQGHHMPPHQQQQQAAPPQAQMSNWFEPI